MAIDFPKGRLLSLTLFLLISGMILWMGSHYKDQRIELATTDIYRQLAKSQSEEVATLIDEKKNATLAVAMALAQNHSLIDSISSTNQLHKEMLSFSAALRKSTEFKNVWIQVVDNAGISLARSWTLKVGDDLAAIRGDVREMLDDPQNRSTISVGHFDMTFKSMVPLFRNEAFLGFIEVITHFNSIAKNIEEHDNRVIILVDPRYRDQLTRPFTETFVADHYIANRNADPDLLTNIAARGLSDYIDPHSDYVIDHESDSLVLNYPLFDTNDQPMANILTFKPLKLINPQVTGIRHSTNLIMMMSALIVGAIILLIESRNSNTRLSGSLLVKILFITGFLVSSILYIGALELLKNDKETAYLDAHNNDLISHYVFVQNKFRSIANLIYQNDLNRPEVVDLLSRAYSDPESRKVARQKLFEKLSPVYSHLKKYNVKQLHFHLANNDSFLRFHRPGKHGDNLSGIRSTVEWVNQNHSPIEGFEEGRIYNGYRFVYPLFNVSSDRARRHIGSVEVSFSAYALLDGLLSDSNVKGGFLIRKNVVHDKVFKIETSNYSTSPFSGYLQEDSIKEQLNHYFRHIEPRHLSKKQLKEASKRIIEGDVFTLVSNNYNELFSFIPLKNPITRKVVASLILQTDDSYFSNQASGQRLLQLMGLAAIGLMLLFIFREHTSKHNIQQLLKKTQNILDSQESMVIITDGNKLLDCNRKLLDFLGFESLDEFHDNHTCICEKFIRNDRFFHMGVVQKGLTWVQEIVLHPEREHLVAIEDTKGKQHAFALSLNHFNQNYIVSFLDISDTISEHFILENKALHDELTNALNRSFFNQNVQLLIDEAHSKGLRFGIILFDVDHFKSVNDHFGHGVGDQVLVRLVEIVKSGIRSGDSLIRWGGEEFLLLVKTQSFQSIQHMAEHIRLKLQDELHPGVGTVTCSFGFTLYQDPEPVSDTLERTDQALYQAKSQGRNRVVGLTDTDIPTESSTVMTGKFDHNP
ncbi:MAG: diguanylate cyclase [Candidatus Thiodiazotropha sp.]